MTNAHGIQTPPPYISPSTPPPAPEKGSIQLLAKSDGDTLVWMTAARVERALYFALIFHPLNH